MWSILPSLPSLSCLWHFLLFQHVIWGGCGEFLVEFPRHFEWGEKGFPACLVSVITWIQQIFPPPAFMSKHFLFSGIPVSQNNFYLWESFFCSVSFSLWWGILGVVKCTPGNLRVIGFHQNMHAYDENQYIHPTLLKDW